MHSKSASNDRADRDHYGINVQGSDQDSGAGSPYQGPINNMIVVSRNKLHGGGVLVSGHSHNVLVDGNTITDSPVGADVSTQPPILPAPRRYRLCGPDWLWQVWVPDIEHGHVKNALVLNDTTADEAQPEGSL